MKKERYCAYNPFTKLVMSYRNPKRPLHNPLTRVPGVSVRRYMLDQPALLADVEQTHGLYIVGHCSPGSSQISSGGEDDESIDADELARRIRANGLPLDRLKMKLWACNAGRGTLLHRAFARKLLRSLRRVGYSQIAVDAYTLTLGKRQNFDDGLWHNRAYGKQGEQVRASAHRKTFR